MKTHLFHIAYSQETFAHIPAGFGAIDNRSNARADWFEYWPIRASLPSLLQDLAEDDFLGFFSPRFTEKTGLSASALTDYVVQFGASHDILLFSPQPDIAAFFANVFLGEEFFNPGFLAASQAALNDIGLRVNLHSLATDSRNTVFSNYFLARPAFWRAWFELCEGIFRLAESEHSSQGGAPGRAATGTPSLIHPTSYGKGAQLKVFLIERMASLMLAAALPHAWRAKAYEPFKLAWSAHFGHAREEAIICDALKIAHRETGYEVFERKYMTMRADVLARLFEALAKPR